MRTKTKYQLYNNRFLQKILLCIDLIEDDLFSEPNKENTENAQSEKMPIYDMFGKLLSSKDKPKLLQLAPYKSPSQMNKRSTLKAGRPSLNSSSRKVQNTSKSLGSIKENMKTNSIKRFFSTASMDLEAPDSYKTSNKKFRSFSSK